MEKTQSPESQAPGSPAWFDPATGIYTSRHAPVELPRAAFLDVAAHVFSHDHGATATAAAALVDSEDGSSLSHAGLREAARSLASGLLRAGVRKGDVVLLLLPSSVLFPVVFLGVASAGAIAAPMSPLSTAEEVGRHAARCGAAVAFASPGAAPLAERLGVKVIEVPDSTAFDPEEFPLFRELLSSSSPPLAAMPTFIRQTDTAALMCSSGTSGESKVAVLTHRNLISAVDLFVRFEASQYRSTPDKNVYLCALPMFHIYGLALFAVGLPSLGSTVVVMRRFDAAAAARAVESHRVTHFPVVPPMLAHLVRAAEGGGGLSLSSLRQVSSGAAPLRAGAVLEFTRSFPHVDFIQGYGMTESTAVGTRGYNTGGARNHASVGLLAPNMQAKVVDWNTGSCQAPTRTGELWLKGPAIMKGYLNDRDATSSTITGDGWLKTGDIVRFDQDGYLYILDRMKEMIKYNGYQIAPADLEAVMITHPEIADVAVASAFDNDSGEIPVAFVVRSSGSNLSASEVIAYVAKRVVHYKKVRKVVFVDSVPRLPAGKTLRRQLRAQLISKI